MRPPPDGRMPASALIRVVLPAPLGPTTHSSSPGRTSSDTPHSARALPYATCRSRTSSMGRYPQVRAHHFGTLHHVLGHALGQQLAVIEHHDPVRKRHHRAHHVLDEDDGRTLVAD